MSIISMSAAGTDLPRTTQRFDVAQLAAPPAAHWLRADGGFMPRLGGNLAAAALYFLLGLAVGHYFAAYGLFPAPIWLPSSVAVVAAILGGWRFLPGLFLGSFLINYGYFGSSLTTAALISLTNAAGPILATQLMRRWRPQDRLFSTFTGVVAFILCAVILHPAITATGGTLALNISGGWDITAMTRTWVSWWLCDSGGTLAFAPCLLMWLGGEKSPDEAGRPLTRQSRLVWIAVAVIVIGLFVAPPAPIALFATLPFLLVVPLSWIALNTSLRAAYTLVSLASVIAMAATAAGQGPFHAPAAINPLQMAGELIVLLTMTVLTIVALFRERRAAEAISRSKSMLLATASHDLRTPLNAILGFADLMRLSNRPGLAPEKVREYANDIHASGALLLGLIDEILDHAKIEAGKREIDPHLLDAPAIANACLELLTSRAAAKNVSLSVKTLGAGALHADELALRQILLNLLSNAVKFTEAGGAVEIRLSLLGDGAGILEVTDTGIGMSEAELEQVLLPFGQAGSNRQRESGTGLGLNIVVRLVELHRGRFSITSAPTKGTTVRISFPVAPDAF
jgi:signal transduction histidine kinase